MTWTLTIPTTAFKSGISFNFANIAVASRSIPIT